MSPPAQAARCDLRRACAGGSRARCKLGATSVPLWDEAPIAAGRARSGARGPESLREMEGIAENGNARGANAPRREPAAPLARRRRPSEPERDEDLEDVRREVVERLLPGNASGDPQVPEVLVLEQDVVVDDADAAAIDEAPAAANDVVARADPDR